MLTVVCQPLFVGREHFFETFSTNSTDQKFTFISGKIWEGILCELATSPIGPILKIDLYNMNF
jgi:hypothetical protein